MVDELHENRRAVRIVVYVVLAATVIVSFLTTGPLWERVRLGELPLWLPFLAPALFTLFVLVFTVDRYIQVRKRNYPVARAMLQLGLAVVFLAFLWPQQARELRAAHDVPPLRQALELLEHRQPSVRALACDALSASLSPEQRAAIVSRLERESDPRVRVRC
ncbi:MAG: hypothetical protein AAFQ82_22760, partial [Myxococcota bacterium]